MAGQIGALGQLVHRPAEWQSKHGAELVEIQNPLMVDEFAWDRIVLKSTVRIYRLVQHRSNHQSTEVGDRGESGANVVHSVVEDIVFEGGNVTTQPRRMVVWSVLDAIWIMRFATLTNVRM